MWFPFLLSFFLYISAIWEQVAQLISKISNLVRALWKKGMARLENYTMFAKDRSYAGSLVAVKGKDKC